MNSNWFSPDWAFFATINCYFFTLSDSVSHCVTTTDPCVVATCTYPEAGSWFLPLELSWWATHLSFLKKTGTAGLCWNSYCPQWGFVVVPTAVANDGKVGVTDAPGQWGYAKTLYCSSMRPLFARVFAVVFYAGARDLTCRSGKSWRRGGYCCCHSCCC